MQRTVKRIILTIVALIVIAGIAAPLGAVRSFADKKELNTDGAKRSQVTLDFGNSVGIRFNAAAEFTSVSFEITVASNGGKKAVAELYRWDTDMTKTLSGSLIASKSFDDWKKGGILGVTSGDAAGGAGSFSSGEYYFRLSLKAGGSFKFDWYTPVKDNVEAFVGDHYKEGSPLFYIDQSGDKNSFLGKLSDRGAPYTHPIPEETKLTENDEVVKLGVDSTLWMAVDGLGRTLPTYEEIGNKKERLVGIFYWTWHNNNAKGKPANVNEILKNHPDAIDKYEHRVWKDYNGAAFFWNEPLFGYYTEMDDYVLRKHAELLADAGIDFVLFDCTNGTLLFENEFRNLLKVWSQAKAEGVNVPKISFMLPFWDYDFNKTDIKALYYRLYKMGEYQDMWLYWEGKPLLMGIKDSLDPNDEEEADILNFFTFRKGEPSYWKDDSTDDEWGWLHVYPQAKYYNEDGTVEQMTVGIAQNADYVERKLYAMNGPHNMGRGYSEQKDFSYTYTYRGESIVCSSSMENAHYYGINFQEQWNYALETDPEIVFVTGWNEWLVGRYEEWEGMKNAFPDQCNDANSRDIEPTKGELKDYYYYQLVANVRRYKGMSLPKAYPAKTIDISGGAEQWENTVSYNHYINNTLERNSKGFQGCSYTAEATRNDFKTLKASYDDDKFYFYAETVDPITSYEDENWIRLILDTGAATKDSKDWEDFEFIIGRETGTSETLSVERSKGGWSWEKVGDAKYTVQGNVLQIEVERSLLGVTESDFTIGFKFADNNLQDGDIMTLYTDGDAAPGGRFTFVLSDKNPMEIPSSDEIKATEGPENTNGGCKGCGSTVSGGTALLFIGFASVSVLVFIKKGDCYEEEN